MIFKTTWSVMDVEFCLLIKNTTTFSTLSEALNIIYINLSNSLIY